MGNGPYAPNALRLPCAPLPRAPPCNVLPPAMCSPAGHNICVLLNEAYDTLMDGNARAAYNAQLEVALADEKDTYTGEGGAG